MKKAKAQFVPSVGASVPVELSAPKKKPYDRDVVKAKKESYTAAEQEAYKKGAKRGNKNGFIAALKKLNPKG